MSIRDACELGKLLVEDKWASFGDLGTVLFKYEQVMLPRGRNLVLSSRARGLPEEGAHRDPNIDENRKGKVVAIDPIYLDRPVRSPPQVPEAMSQAPSEIEVQ